MSDIAMHSPMSQQYVAVSIRFLCAGVQLQFPIFDGSKILLLGKGQIVSEQFIKKLSERGIARIIMHESEISRLAAGQSHGDAESVPVDRSGHVSPARNVYSDQLDVMVQKSQALGVNQQGEPFAASVTLNQTSSYDNQVASEFTQRHNQTINFMQESFAEMANDEGVNLPGIKQAGEAALGQLAHDPDLYACLGINPASDTYPARHSTHVSMVATLIGMRMGLDNKMLTNLATGCLIHDAGMLKINRDVYEKPAKLTAIEFLEITKHPVAVFDILKKVRSLETSTSMVAYQMHERCNGSGYPRGSNRDKIHPLAKIAMVADVFVALVSSRPHRPGLLPYKAMEKLLLDGNRGLYDSQVVRTLLECISLFPIGSYVELNDDRIAKVIRTTGETFNQPILEVWKPYETHLTPEIINLTEEKSLQIIRPLSPHDEKITQSKVALTSQDFESNSIEDNWE